MKKAFYFLLFILIYLQLNAQQLSRVYVLSEGGFSEGTSQLSMLNMQDSLFTQSILNPGNIGLYPDGIFLFNKNIYITEQGNFGGSGKIYKLDSVGTVIASTEVGTNPYSLTITNNKVYITSGPASNVSVLDINNFSFINDITVGVYPQEITSNENYVFVANNSLWGGDSDSTVSVIDVKTDSVVSTITVKLNPSSLAITADNHLLVGCPGDENTGIIYKIELDTFTKIDSFLIPGYGFGKGMTVDERTNSIYFKSSSNDIIKIDMQTKNTSRVVNPVDAVFIYGYGYEPNSQTHYLLDAKDFSSNGSLLIYNMEGTLIKTYETGIAPRRVAFDYSEVISDVNEIKIENGFVLNQNYPNPFNPSTIIKYQIPTPLNPPFMKGGNPRGVYISLKVFDILGEEVSTLVNKNQAPGNYTVEFDAAELPSGTYFYQLKAGNFTKTKKMILLR